MLRDPLELAGGSLFVENVTKRFGPAVAAAFAGLNNPFTPCADAQQYHQSDIRTNRFQVRAGLTRIGTFIELPCRNDGTQGAVGSYFSRHLFSRPKGLNVSGSRSPPLLGS